MADTTLLTRDVEANVRQELHRQFGQPFEKSRQVVGRCADGRPATYEFDAVSTDGTIVVAIKSSSGLAARGRYPAGKVAAAYKDLYFLSLANAQRRILVFTDPEFYAIFERDSNGKLAAGLELLCIPLSAELKAQVKAVQGKASEEMQGRTSS